MVNNSFCILLDEIYELLNQRIILPSVLRVKTFSFSVLRVKIFSFI